MGNISAKLIGRKIPLNQIPGHLNIETLPEEILLRFTDHLTPTQLHTLQSTSKTNKTIFGSDYIWKIKFQKHFSNDVFVELEKQFQALQGRQSQFWQTAFRAQDEKEYASLTADDREFLFIIKEPDVGSLDILLNRVRRKIYLTDFLSRQFKKVTYLELMQQSNHQPLLDLIYSYRKLVTRHPLHWAIQCRQPIMELRQFSTHAHSKNTAGLTGLYLAAEEGNALAIRFLCEEQQINPNAVNHAPDSSMPLYIAAQKGHTDAVNELLEAGAAIEVTFMGFTPLYIACQNGRTLTVQLLLQKQANKNAICGDGSTPLYIAAQQGHADTANMLIEAGAAIEATFRGGYTPLYIACSKGHTSVVQLLLQKQANPNAIGGDGSTSIHVAAQNGHTKIVSLLLCYGVNIEQAWGEFTPLYSAVENGHLETVQLLLKNQANPNGVNEAAPSPLYIAAKKGYTEIVSLLLDYGANLEQGSPFSTAAQNGRLKTVRLMLQKGANPNTINRRGLTPLYLAAQKGHRKTVKLLLEIGAHVGEGEIDNINNPALKILLTLKAYIEKIELVQSQPPVGFFTQPSDPQSTMNLIAARDLLTWFLIFDDEKLIVANLREMIDEYQFIDEDLEGQLQLCIPSRHGCAIM
ncbi:ankyrin repeat domain-containing protein [Legionella rowbothamii]|uniref:ankyrin repeat domain-containing protein n=1 Tax=Legionella rowbothamii TaxID=96229 RepID=UPI001055B22D|nr:ankyrin repeat domain-containing protein [Legionella rowbothamii]